MQSKKMFGAVVCGAVVSVALAAGGAGAAPPFDHVVGGGQNNPPSGAINHFSLNAKSGPNGEDATGKFEFHDTRNPPTERFDADIRCLRVAGNRATMVGEIVRNRNNGALAGRYVIVFVEDNGPPTGGVQRDTIRNALQPANAPEPSCPPPNDLPDGGTSAGNLTVRDAS